MEIHTIVVKKNISCSNTAPLFSMERHINNNSFCLTQSYSKVNKNISANVNFLILKKIKYKEYLQQPWGKWFSFETINSLCHRVFVIVKER